MSGLICVAGGKGAPGATTLALAMTLTCAETITLVDADPDGGDLAPLIGLPSSPGLVTLAAASRHRFAGHELKNHTQPLSPTLGLVASPSSSDQVETALAGLGRLFAEYLAAGLTIVDVGRWRSDSAASELVSAAASTVLVIHPTVAGVAHARSQYEDLAGRCSDVVVACRGDRPYDATEVAEAIGCGTATVIPVDRVGASMLSGAPKERWLRRTPLARSARGLVDSLTQNSAVAS